MSHYRWECEKCDAEWIITDFSDDCPFCKIMAQQSIVRELLDMQARWDLSDAQIKRIVELRKEYGEKE